MVQFNYQRFGYARVSTGLQNFDLQKDKFGKYLLITCLKVKMIDLV